VLAISKGWIWFGGAVSIAGAVAILMSRDPQESSIENPHLIAKNAAGHAEAPRQANVNTAAPTQVEPGTTGPRPTLHQALNASGSWRPVVYSLKNQAAIGGTFYAHKMLSYCKVAMAGLTEPRERVVLQGRDSAMQAVRDRCGDFVVSDFEADQSLSAEKNDPLQNAGKSLHDARAVYAKTKSSGPLQEALDVVLAQRDPLLVDELGLRLVAYTNPSTGKPAYFFGGRVYAVGESPDIGLAAYLLPCELGLQCDESEPRAQLRCALGAGCEGGRAAEVQEMLRSRPDEFAKVKALSKEMASAVTRGDSMAFMPR